MNNGDYPELPVVQYWHASVPTPRIAQGLSSFAEQNPDMRHLIFDETRAAAFIAKHYSQREVRAFHACALPAMQADYFRYCAVLTLGGLYADADLRCVADVSPLVKQSSGTIFARPDLQSRVIQVLRYPYRAGRYWDLDNSPLAFREPGHPLLRLAVTVATANIERRVADGPQGVWMLAGQGVFTSIYLLAQLGSIDAFRRYVGDTVLEPTASLFCEIVGSESVAREVLADVDIRPRRDRSAWMQPLPKPMPGEQPHWGMSKQSIFRNPGEAL